VLCACKAAALTPRLASALHVQGSCAAATARKHAYAHTGMGNPNLRVPGVGWAISPERTAPSA